MNLSQFGLRKNGLILISVSRLTEEKGIDMVIKALAQIPKDIQVNYWIVGSGTQEMALRKLANDIGVDNRIVFLGHQVNPYVFLKSADVFILPSKIEGFSNSLLESMYCSLPSIVTKYDQYIEEFVQMSKGGLVVDLNDMAAMSSAIIQMAQSQDFRKIMGENARKYILEKHVLSVGIGLYQDLFIRYARNQNAKKSFSHKVIQCP